MHDHNHHHPEGDRLETAKKHKKKLTYVLIMVIGFAVVEVIGGIYANSLALISDAGHMVIDAAAIALSLFAVTLSSRPASPQNSYSLVRVEILAAFINGITIIALAGFILYEAVQRLQSPEEIKGEVLLLVATIGMFVNIFSAWILWDSAHSSINIRGAMLHILGDLAGSVGAIIAGIAVIFTGATFIDPLVSVLIAMLILRSCWGLLKESTNVLMEGAPPNIDIEDVKKEILAVHGVVEVHDLHIWSISPGSVILTAHVCVAVPESSVDMLANLTYMIEKQYNITHTTIQIEDKDRHNCQVSC